MRVPVLFLFSVVIGGSIGCASSGSSAAETTAASASAAAVTAPRFEALLKPMGGAMSGEVTVGPGNRAGEFRVNLTLRGSEAGQQHPWHIHTGRCDTPGPVVGSMVAYPVLQIRGDGNFDLRQTIREQLEPGRSYYVDIHASRSDMDRILACGDLIPAAG